jgi:transposase
VDWKAKVGLFEQLRREHEFGVGTIAGVAAKFGVHRRVVRRAIASALPPAQHYPERAKPKLGAVEAFIDQVLDEDCRAPRKQRHTARRIHRRILREFPDAAVAESTVRNHVRERKRQLGLLRRETFVPQSYRWAQEAQVDWYEAWVDLGDERTKVQVFAMRSMASGAAFHRAYLHATQQAFLEAHEHAFAYFGGVFTMLRYDNLASAVRKILRGHRREETVRFMAFRSHWRFAAEFCTPGEGHEKGGVEGEGGYFRRNHLVPVPCKTGMISREEIASGQPKCGAPQRSPALTAEDAASRLTRSTSMIRSELTSPRYCPGDAVRARNINPPYHTRLPRYTRGRTGVVQVNRGAHVFPDSYARGLGEDARHLYTVRFTARELWGDTANPHDAVHVDLWEDYLEPV